MDFAEHIAAADADVQEHLGGVPVTYTPAVGLPLTVLGIFDENYQQSVPGQVISVEDVGPWVGLRLADLAPNDPETDDPRLTIKGKLYKVVERRPDSVREMIRLRLGRADL